MQDQQLTRWLAANAPHARVVSAWHGHATSRWWALVGPHGADALVSGDSPAELLDRLVGARRLGA